MFINFDQHARDATRFIDQLAQSLGYEEQAQAGFALRSVLHTLRDRISTYETVNLLSQLPLFLKAIYVEGWRYEEKPKKIKTLNEFVEKVNTENKKYNGEFSFYVIDINSIKIIITSLELYVKKEELEKILSQLPEEFKALMAA